MVVRVERVVAVAKVMALLAVMMVAVMGVAMMGRWRLVASAGGGG